jgi:hypothetical protein
MEETNIGYQNIPNKCGENKIPNMQADYEGEVHISIL